MQVDQSTVRLYEVTLTNDQYPQVFDEPRYKRIPFAIELIDTQLGIKVDDSCIIKSAVWRDNLTLVFYVR